MNSENVVHLVDSKACSAQYILDLAVAAYLDLLLHGLIDLGLLGNLFQTHLRRPSGNAQLLLLLLLLLE